MSQAHTTPSLAALKESGFYPDIVISLERYMQFMHDSKQCSTGRTIAEEFAYGYLHAREFDIKHFRPKIEDAHFDLKESYADAIQVIFTTFGDRLPLQFYQTLAFMCLRENPAEDARIPDIAHLLPTGLSWQSADTVLHTFPICYRLNFHIQTIIHRHTGRILGHSCGCNHQLAAMPNGNVDVPMGDSFEIMLEETESYLRHGLGQRFLIHFGMPHGLGKSVKMKIADGEGDTDAEAYEVQSGGPTTLQRMILKVSPHP
jgi:hypothetical protein